MKYPPDTNSGTDGGAVAIRDLTNATGGGSKINCVNYSYTIVGKNVDGFEWNLYAQMDNYADTKPGTRREHCAFYSKANKYGTATNWAAVLEVHDHNGTGACVGAEVDIWTKGEDNGNRIGLDVMCAGGNDVVDQPGVVGATAAIRSSVPDSNPLAYWSFGAWLRGVKQAGVSIKSCVAGAVRGVELLGRYLVGIDTSQAQCVTAIRLARGQVISLDATDAVTVGFGDNSRVFIKFCGAAVFEVDVGTGDIYKKSKKIL